MSFFNADFDSLRRNRFSQYQAALQRILGARQAADQSYTAGTSQVGIDRPNILRGILNNFAGRGMAYSSGYGTANQTAETGFANKLSQLAAARNAAQSQADLEQNQETANYNYDLADYSNQQAAYEAQQRQAQVAALAEQQQQRLQQQLLQSQIQRNQQQSQQSQNTRPGTYHRSGIFRGLRRRL